MEKVEYRILNMSEVEARLKKDKVSLIDILNELGKEGWTFCAKLKESSWILMRKKPESVTTAQES
ncbi:MAG: hypothetical protein HC883_00305 [Bdellovibrionaceae bacterium]|nr:hypothetical protein [Pseudobdellovibrionaceae bacterium]